MEGRGEEQEEESNIEKKRTQQQQSFNSTGGTERSTLSLAFWVIKKCEMERKKKMKNIKS